jgi:hypothetical protein
MGADDFSLEVAFKSLNYLADLSQEMLHRVDSISPALERYGRGDLEVHEHFAGEIGGYCRRTRIRQPVDFVEPHLTDRLDQLTVPVWVSDLLKGFRPRSSVERLQALQDCLMFDSQPVKPELLFGFRTGRKLGEILIPGIWRVFDYKLRVVIELTSSKIEKLKNKVIQGRFQIVSDLPNKDGAQDRWGVIDSLNDWRVGRGVKEEGGLVDFPLKAFDVFACPSYSRSSIIKGWLSVIGYAHDQKIRPKPRGRKPVADAENPA